MSDITREQIDELFERSKGDRAIIVGSEVRMLCGTMSTPPDGFARCTVEPPNEVERLRADVAALQAALRAALLRLDAIYADEQEPGEYGGPVRPGWLRDALGKP